ncbi:MAG: glycosyltransferase family 2 protein [bacterium]|nr:glycosyltransferase family 2 protein [bacterium]
MQRVQLVCTTFELQLPFVLFLFLFFSGLLVYLSFRSFLGGVAYLAFFRQQLATPPSSFLPFATVIVPCKGLDEGLRENLSALLKLNYPEYELIFVVDNESDPAVEPIRAILNDGSRLKNKLVIAPTAVDCSQKVENIRTAVAHANPRSQVLVFVDSDARPQKQWLRELVAPLEPPNVGAATGYRWFLSTNPTFASELRSAWNASIASALGPNTASNFCWGGSTAVRRQTWEGLNLSERLKGTLSDDFTVTRAMKDAALEIVFVPQALTPSMGNCTIKELFEFTTRQMKITRVYKPQLWALSFFGSALFCGVILSAFLIILLSRSNSWLVWSAIATLAIVSALSIGKAWLRLRAVSLIIPTASRQFLPQITLWLLAPPLFLWNCISALVSRTINWRGIRYRLISATETERLK